MSQIDDLLSVDYVQLWKEGAITIPRCAEAYSVAASFMHITAAYESDVFRSRSTLDLSQLEASWTSLRDRFQDDILVSTSNRLTRTATALIDFAVALDTEDDENFSAIDAVREDLEETSPSYTPIPPDEITEPPTSNDDPPNVEWNGDDFVPKDES